MRGFYPPDNKWSLFCLMGKCCWYDMLRQQPQSVKFIVRVLILVGCSTFYHWNKSTFTTLRSKLFFLYTCWVLCGSLQHSDSFKMERMSPASQTRGWWVGASCIGITALVIGHPVWRSVLWRDLPSMWLCQAFNVVVVLETCIPTWELPSYSLII